jgi:hypothetical protein
MSQLRHHLLLLLLLSLPLGAAADMVPFRCDGPGEGPVTVLPGKGGTCGGFSAHGATVRFDYPASGRIIASADGRTVVMVQSYLYGTVDRDQQVIGFEGGREVADPIAVYVYRDAALVASHRFSELLDRRWILNPSVSHLSWVREAPPSITGQTFDLITSTFEKITFDTRTGAVHKRGDSAAWERCSVIASGKVDLAKGALDPVILWKTNQRPGAPLPFTRAEGVSLTDRAWTMGCFERRGGGLVLTSTL